MRYHTDESSTLSSSAVVLASLLLLGWGGCFLDYSVAARGTPHQADPVLGEPAGDVPLPELLGNAHKDTHTHTQMM